MSWLGYFLSMGCCHEMGNGFIISYPCFGPSLRLSWGRQRWWWMDERTGSFDWDFFCWGVCLIDNLEWMGRQLIERDCIHSFIYSVFALSDLFSSLPWYTPNQIAILRGGIQKSLFLNSYLWELLFSSVLAIILLALDGWIRRFS